MVNIMLSFFASSYSSWFSTMELVMEGTIQSRDNLFGWLVAGVIRQLLTWIIM